MSDLEKKLQIKPGHRVLLLQAPRGFNLNGVSAKGPHDVVLLFAKDQKTLAKHAKKAVSAGGILWIAYPKTASGVATDLTRDQGWEPLAALGYGGVSQIAIDQTWSALRFEEGATRPAAKRPRAQASALPEDLVAAVGKSVAAKKTWASLAPSHVKEYVSWVVEAKKPETRARRIGETVKMLAAGQRDRNAKYR